MSTFTHPMFKHHEQIVFCHEPEVNLHGIIAIHDTRLGPAVGGCRIWQYASEEDALTDVLRLSRGMTYKNALAGLPFGGGKSVLISAEKSPALWKAFAGFLNSLGGRYITAEDVGTCAQDMAALSRYSPFVTGLAARSGDPSPFTALGVFEGIRACLAHQRGTDSLHGIRVAVQGAGQVGYRLCQLLHQAGAELWISDISATRLERCVQEFKATPVAENTIYDTDADVFSPCALGATLNDDTIARLRATVVAGSANNQLARSKHDQLLHSKGILYAPDYVINAGGIISVSFDPASQQTSGTELQQQAVHRVKQINQTLTRIFTEAAHSQSPTGAIADSLAEQALRQQGHTRFFPPAAGAPAGR